MMKASVGVIGGTGLYDMAEAAVIEEVELRTAFGAPSGPYTIVNLGGKRTAFLSRHGRGHRMIPSAINYRANIFGFKMLGVERVLSVSAVGSLSEAIHPNEIVVPDQFFDFTRGRKTTFFDEGLAAHVEFADPTCPELRRLLVEQARQLSYPIHEDGTYVCIEGPQFSTRVESAFFRGQHMSIIGMTNATEAKLAREAELCYATLAMVTDYDCWYEGESVTVDVVVSRLQRNASMARSVISNAVDSMRDGRTCRCGSALHNAIITQRDAVSPETLKRLGPLVGRYLGAPPADSLQDARDRNDASAKAGKEGTR